MSLGAFHSALYRGELMHARHDELARRAFTYGVYMAALDLDEIPALDRELRLFSHRGLNLFAFDDRDYCATLSPSALAPDASGLDALRAGLSALRAGNGIAEPHTTRLVTNLRVAGYVFNPVSFFIDYDANGRIASAIAEVNNTYGGRHRYVLGPGQIGADPFSRRVGFRHVRELYVSPFLHGELTYDFWFDAPLDGSELAIEMHVTRSGDATARSATATNRPQHTGQRVLTARFTGSRLALRDRNLAMAAARYPLMTAQVIGLIHLEAFKLRFAGIPYRRPGVDHRPLKASP